MRLITFLPADKDALACLWAAYKLASRPEHGKWRDALGLEDALVAVTDPEKTGIRVAFRDCGMTHDLEASHIDQIAPELTVFLTARGMPEAAITSGAGVILHLEDSQFGYAKSLIPKIMPPPTLVRHYVRLEEILNDEALSLRVKPGQVHSSE